MIENPRLLVVDEPRFEDETNELEGKGIELVDGLVVGELMLVDDVSDITTAEDIVNIGVACSTDEGYSST